MLGVFGNVFTPWFSELSRASSQPILPTTLVDFCTTMAFAIWFPIIHLCPIHICRYCFPPRISILFRDDLHIAVLSKVILLCRLLWSPSYSPQTLDDNLLWCCAVLGIWTVGPNQQLTGVGIMQNMHCRRNPYTHLSCRSGKYLAIKQYGPSCLWRSSLTAYSVSGPPGWYGGMPTAKHQPWPDLRLLIYYCTSRF